MISRPLAAALATAFAFTALWAWSLRLRDASIVDVWWGPGFVVAAWIAWALAPAPGWAQGALLACVTLWGLRLGLMALGASLDPLALLGPALMTGLIVKLSGVPMLEAHLAGRPGYAEWRARTGALLPPMRKGRAQTRPSD